jgi:hypothetical protein
MSDILKLNAFHVLGLDTSANEKDILKRSRDIINRLKIDDLPIYDLDVGLFENFRTVVTVKDALQRLQTARKRIKEYFFWFQISDAVDVEASECLKKQDYTGAMHIWEDASSKGGAKSFFYKRNLAILYCLGLSVENDSHYLDASLLIWKELYDSDKFWSTFYKTYKLHNEQTASDEIVLDFATRFTEYLSDIYTELHQVHNDPAYILKFQNVFPIKGAKLEKDILNPVYQSINEAVETLEGMNVSADKVFDEQEAEQIRKLVQVIQLELNKLIDLGLLEDSHTKIMRDRGANSLRKIVLDLHNNLEELETSRNLLKLAIQMAGTDSVRSKLNGELEQIEKNLKNEAENFITIEVPGSFGGGTFLFKHNYVEYDKTKLFYKDIVGISYQAKSFSFNFIPLSQSYSFMIGTKDRSISLSFGTTLHIGGKTKREAWGKIVTAAATFIEPTIVKKLVERIFDDEETVRVGDISFTKDGYFRSKLFGGRDTVYWRETIYIPVLSDGSVHLFRDIKGQKKNFTSIAMSEVNAVVLPELLQACYDRTH